jgi:hypothetical protein
MSRPKPVRVETFDGRVHEVDIRLVDKVFTAWGFVDRSMVQGVQAATQVKAVANWKKEYQALHTPTVC